VALLKLDRVTSWVFAPDSVLGLPTWSPGSSVN